jgi:hypothetical protein
MNMLAARPFMYCDIPDDEIKERYRQVGGEPSHVFARSFKNVLSSQ